MKIFAKIRFYISAFIIAFVTAVFLIPTLLLFPKFKGKALHFFNRLILFLIGGKIEQSGSMDPDAQMILMNHQGIIDIIAIEASSYTHPRWVAKKELFEIPWFGHALKAGGMIAVNRQNKAGLIKFIKDSKQTIEQTNRAIAIFPEGTRNPTQKLHSFKAGAKIVAEKLKLKVQPVIITGSKWLLNEHNKTAHNSTVKITYLPSFTVDKSDKQWYENLAATMQKEIDKELEENQRAR